MRVKFCGITNLDDAAEAVRLGAWAVGLIHYDKSPRCVEPAAAAEIGAAFRRKCEIVGVFVNPTLEEVDKAVEDAALTMVQLNGAEGAQFCGEVARRTGVKVIKAIHVASAADIHAAEAYRTDFHLFDRRGKGLWGGTGESFDWELLRGHRSDVPDILAGGLRPDNVAGGGRRHPALRGRRRQRRRGRARAQGPRGDGRLLRGGAAGRHRQRMSAVEERFGPYGGRYVPETLIGALDELTAAWGEAREDAGFMARLDLLRRDFIGRPTPLYLAERLSERVGSKVYLKREDLAHTGAHKINNAVGQALLAARMGKPRVIAETGAGQHGVATATACALLGLECVVYMGSEDIRRQAPNVERMQPARRRGGAGRGRRPHPQGGGQRRDPRLGRQRRDDPLRDRLGRRPGALSRRWSATCSG